VIDITEGNRTNLADARDPGGRLGPHLSGGTPDLRNLDLYFQCCMAGDIIFCVSDGVHDNFDPQQIGKVPLDFNIKCDNWEEAEKQFGEETEEVKTKFRSELFEKKIAEITHDHAEKLLPEQLVDSILSYCHDLTTKSREFLEQNLNKKLPADFAEYPGKLDHATMVAVQVGKFHSGSRLGGSEK